MSDIVRRSYLVVSPLDRQAVEQAWRCNPDAVALDLHGVLSEKKLQARAAIKDLLPLAQKGATEVFVNCSQAYLAADARAAAWPGLDGIVLSYPETADDIRAADALLTDLERERGLDANSVEIVAILGTAKGLWNIRQIITASKRVTTAGLDESALIADMGILANPDEDPLVVFGRGRLVMEGAGMDEFHQGHHGIQRLGLGYQLSVFPSLKAKPEDVLNAARVAKENAFNGALCLDPSWVEPCTRGFTPSDDRLQYLTEVRAAYAEAVAQGRGAVSFRDGGFVERPFDEDAKKIIALRMLCAQRDAQKAAARAREGLA